GGLRSSGSPSPPGQPVTFTANVGTRTMPVAFGTVSFVMDGVVVATEPVNAEGVASFTTEALPLGSSALTAVYNGQGSDLGSTSAPLTQVVVPYTTAPTVSGSMNPRPVGQPLPGTANVAAAGMPGTSGTEPDLRQRA